MEIFGINIIQIFGVTFVAICFTCMVWTICEFIYTHYKDEPGKGNRQRRKS